MQRRNKNWLYPGLEVTHIDNVDQKMIVEKLLFKTKEFDVGNDKPQMRRLFSGVKCHWWGPHKDNPDKKVLYEQEFHAKELVPWSIAIKGEKEIAVFQFEKSRG